MTRIRSKQNVINLLEFHQRHNWKFCDKLNFTKTTFILVDHVILERGQLECISESFRCVASSLYFLHYPLHSDFLGNSKAGGWEKQHSGDIRLFVCERKEGVPTSLADMQLKQNPLNCRAGRHCYLHISHGIFSVGRLINLSLQQTHYLFKMQDSELKCHMFIVRKYLYIIYKWYIYFRVVATVYFSGAHSSTLSLRGWLRKNMHHICNGLKLNTILSSVWEWIESFGLKCINGFISKWKNILHFSKWKCSC